MERVVRGECEEKKKGSALIRGAGRAIDTAAPLDDEDQNTNQIWGARGSNSDGRLPAKGCLLGVQRRCPRAASRLSAAFSARKNANHIKRPTPPTILSSLGIRFGVPAAAAILIDWSDNITSDVLLAVAFFASQLLPAYQRVPRRGRRGVAEQYAAAGRA